MHLTFEEIRALLRLVDESTCEEFRLEADGLRLVMRKSAGGGEAEPAAAAPAVLAGPAPGEAPPAAAPASGPPGADRAIPDGVVAVTAPMVGTFYRAPAPGAPPFVEVGDEVQAQDTVCILEVMKLMNSVTAGVGGRVVRICVENATLVEHGQPLVLIEPGGGRAGA